MKKQPSWTNTLFNMVDTYGLSEVLEAITEYVELTADSATNSKMEKKWSKIAFKLGELTVEVTEASEESEISG